MYTPSCPQSFLPGLCLALAISFGLRFPGEEAQELQGLSSAHSALWIASSVVGHPQDLDRIRALLPAGENGVIRVEDVVKAARELGFPHARMRRMKLVNIQPEQLPALVLLRVDPNDAGNLSVVDGVHKHMLHVLDVDPAISGWFPKEIVCPTTADRLILLVADQTASPSILMFVGVFLGAFGVGLVASSRALPPALLNLRRKLIRAVAALVSLATCSCDRTDSHGATLTSSTSDGTAIGSVESVATAAGRLALPSVFSFGLFKGVPFTTMEIPIRNEGTEPMQVHVTSVGCGCASASTEPDSLGPGAEGKVKVLMSFTPSKRNYDVPVELSVKGNSFSSARHIRLIGTYEGLYTTPARLRMRATSYDGLPATASFQLRATPGSGSRFRAIAWSSNHPAVRVTQDAANPTIEWGPGNVNIPFRVEAAMADLQIPPGEERQHHVQLAYAMGNDEFTLVVPVVIQEKARITSDLTAIVKNYTTGSEEEGRLIFVTCHAPHKTPPAISLDSTLEAAGVTAQFDAIDKSKESEAAFPRTYSLRLKLPAQLVSRGNVSGSLHITMHDNEFKTSSAEVRVLLLREL